MTTDLPQVIPLELATFTFAQDEPHAGEEGVVVAYAIRHSEGVLQFDTGFGFGNEYVDARYRPQSRRIDEALRHAGIDMADVTAVLNCHLHIDHAGQNSAFPGVPIHVQAAEWHEAHTTEHTVLEWIDFDGADYRHHDGDYEVLPGITALATPGHTPGHQSLAIETSDGLILLAGQAVYSAGEWAGAPGAREGYTRAADRSAYADSVARLRALRPERVLFAHDRAAWSAEQVRR